MIYDNMYGIARDLARVVKEATDGHTNVEWDITIPIGLRGVEGEIVVQQHHSGRKVANIKLVLEEGE